MLQKFKKTGARGGSSRTAAHLAEALDGAKPGHLPPAALAGLLRCQLQQRQHVWLLLALPAKHQQAVVGSPAHAGAGSAPAAATAAVAAGC